MTTQVNRVLIVDDNEANRTVLRAYLEGEGITVEVAFDGQAAVDMLDSQPFDILLLGVPLPKLSGYEVLEHMKANSALAQIPVIMISSVADLDSVARCIELGAD